MNENKPARTGQVIEQNNRLGEACDGLHRALSLLEDRLIPVLRERCASPSNKTEAPSLVPLAQLLSERCESIEHAICRINDFVDHLEL